MTIKEFFNGKENPGNKYEESPFFAWLVFITLFLIMISGLIAVYKN